MLKAEQVDDHESSLRQAALGTFERGAFVLNPARRGEGRAVLAGRDTGRARVGKLAHTSVCCCVL